MHLLLAMLSTQLYSPSAAPEPGGHPFTEVLMDSQEVAAKLLTVVLRHFIERRPLPPQAPIYVPPNTERGGVLRLVRSAAGKAKKGTERRVNSQEMCHEARSRMCNLAPSCTWADVVDCRGVMGIQFDFVDAFAANGRKFLKFCLCACSVGAVAANPGAHIPCSLRQPAAGHLASV